MQDVQFFCDVTNITFKNPGPSLPLFVRLAEGMAEYTVPRAPATISAGMTVTFPCSISENVRVIIDGIQWPIVLIHIQIRTVYMIGLGPFHWRRDKTSQQFTWKPVSGGYQWLEGDASDVVKGN